MFPGTTPWETLFRSGRVPFREISLRNLFTLFALAVCAVMIGIFVLDAAHGRALAIAGARSDAQDRAESLARQAADTFEAVDGVLLTLAQSVENDGTGPAQRHRLRESMAALLLTMPRLHGLLVIDGRGRFVVSNTSAAERPDLHFAQQPYFAYHRLHASSTIHISAPVRSQTENTWVVEATRRIERADGVFAGVAVAQIALDYFVHGYAAVEIGASGTISLMNDDGTILARRPRAYIGEKLLKAGVYGDPYRYQLSGSYIRASALDGVRRLFAFRRLDRYPLLVTVSEAENEYLADWRSDVWANGLVLAVVIAIFGGLATGLTAQINHRRRAEETLARLAIVDWLTGLANRRQFDLILEREWLRAVRERTPLALLMIDVDNFKAYNDRYGHPQGDEVLATVARTIAANVVRPADLTARYGGEEFAVILPATDAASALLVAERIRGAIVALGVPHEAASGQYASVSIGAASIVPPYGSNPGALIKAADSALYAAKRAGRNCTCAAPEPPLEAQPPPLD